MELDLVWALLACPAAAAVMASFASVAVMASLALVSVSFAVAEAVGKGAADAAIATTESGGVAWTVGAVELL